MNEEQFIQHVKMITEIMIVWCVQTYGCKHFLLEINSFDVLRTQLMSPIAIFHHKGFICDILCLG
jgi:hypothetical protein